MKRTASCVVLLLLTWLCGIPTIATSGVPLASGTPEELLEREGSYREKHREMRIQNNPTYSIAHNYPVATLTLSIVLSDASQASSTTLVRLATSSACTSNAGGSTDVDWATGNRISFITTSAANTVYVCLTTDGTTWQSLSRTEGGNQFFTIQALPLYIISLGYPIAEYDLVVATTGLASSSLSKLYLDVEEDCSTGTGVAGTSIRDFTSGSQATFYPTTAAASVYLCLSTDGGLTYTSLTNFETGLKTFAILSKPTYSYEELNKPVSGMALSLGFSGDVSSSKTCVVLQTSSCSSVSSGIVGTEVEEWSVSGTTVTFDPVPNSPIENVLVCLTNRCGLSGAVYKDLALTDGSGNTFDIIGAPLFTVQQPVAQQSLFITLTTAVASSTTYLTLSGDCSGSPPTPAGSTTSLAVNDMVVIFGPTSTDTGVFVCLSNNNQNSFISLANFAGGNPYFDITASIPNPTYALSLSYPIETISLVLALSSSPAAPLSTTLRLSESVACTFPSGLVSGDTQWTSGTSVTMDTPQRTSSAVYVCLSTNIGAPNEAFYVLNMVDASTTFPILTKPTHGESNARAGFTLRLHFTSLVHSSLTYVRVVDGSVSCATGLSGEADLTVPWTSASTTVALESSQALTGAVVCLSNDNALTWVPIDRTDGGVDGFSVSAPITLPTANIDHVHPTAYFPLAWILSSSDSASPTTFMKLSSQLDCSDGPLLGTELEPYTDDSTTTINVIPIPSSPGTVIVCMSINVGAPNELYTLLSLSNGGDTFPVAAYPTYTISPSVVLAGIPLFLSFTTSTPGSSITRIRLDENEDCSGTVPAAETELEQWLPGTSVTEMDPAPWAGLGVRKTIWVCVSVNYQAPDEFYQSINQTGFDIHSFQLEGEPAFTIMTRTSKLLDYEEISYIPRNGYLKIILSSDFLVSPYTYLRIQNEPTCNGTGPMFGTEDEAWASGVEVFFYPVASENFPEAYVCLTTDYNVAQPTWRQISRDNGVKFVVIRDFDPTPTLSFTSTFTHTSTEAPFTATPIPTPTDSYLPPTITPINTHTDSYRPPTRTFTLTKTATENPYTPTANLTDSAPPVTLSIVPVTHTHTETVTVSYQRTYMQSPQPTVSVLNTQTDSPIHLTRSFSYSFTPSLFYTYVPTWRGTPTPSTRTVASTLTFTRSGTDTHSMGLHHSMSVSTTTSPTHAPTLTSTSSPTHTATLQPHFTQTASDRPITKTFTPTPTLSEMPTHTHSDTSTRVPTSTTTHTTSFSSTSTPTHSAVPRATHSFTPTWSPTHTTSFIPITRTFSPDPSHTHSMTHSGPAPPSLTWTSTATATLSSPSQTRLSLTDTASPHASFSWTPSPTESPPSGSGLSTLTDTPSPTHPPSKSWTSEVSLSNSHTGSRGLTPTKTVSEPWTATHSFSDLPSLSESVTPTDSSPGTVTATDTGSDPASGSYSTTSTRTSPHTPSPSASPTPSIQMMESHSYSLTDTFSPDSDFTHSVSTSATRSETSTYVPTRTSSDSHSPTLTPSSRKTDSATFEISRSRSLPTPTKSATLYDIFSRTGSPLGSHTHSTTESHSSTLGAGITHSPTLTPSTVTVDATPTFTHDKTSTLTQEKTGTESPATSTPTETLSLVLTPSMSRNGTLTESTITLTDRVTPSPTLTLGLTLTYSESESESDTPSPTSATTTKDPTVSATHNLSLSLTPAFTSTMSANLTHTHTESRKVSGTVTALRTYSGTGSGSGTEVHTFTPSLTPSFSPRITETTTPTRSPDPTPTLTMTPPTLTTTPGETISHTPGVTFSVSHTASKDLTLEETTTYTLGITKTASHSHSQTQTFYVSQSVTETVPASPSPPTSTLSPTLTEPITESLSHTLTESYDPSGSPTDTATHPPDPSLTKQPSTSTSHTLSNTLSPPDTNSETPTPSFSSPSGSFTPSSLTTTQSRPTLSTTDSLTHTDIVPPTFSVENPYAKRTLIVYLSSDEQAGKFSTLRMTEDPECGRFSPPAAGSSDTHWDSDSVACFYPTQAASTVYLCLLTGVETIPLVFTVTSSTNSFAILTEPPLVTYDIRYSPIVHGLPVLIHFSAQDPSSPSGNTALKFDNSSACDTPMDMIMGVVGIPIYYWTEKEPRVTINSTYTALTRTSLYLCISLDSLNNPIPTFQKLSGGPDPLWVVPTPSYTPINPKSGYTLKILLDTNEIASSDTSAYLTTDDSCATKPPLPFGGETLERDLTLAAQDGGRAILFAPRQTADFVRVCLSNDYGANYVALSRPDAEDGYTFNITDGPAMPGYRTPYQSVILAGLSIVLEFDYSVASYSSRVCLSEDAQCTQCASLSDTAPQLQEWNKTVTFPGITTGSLVDGYICGATTYYTPRQIRFELLQNLMPSGQLAFSPPPTYAVDNSYAGRSLRVIMSTPVAASDTTMVRLTTDPTCGIPDNALPPLAAGTASGRPWTADQGATIVFEPSMAEDEVYVCLSNDLEVNFMILNTTEGEPSFAILPATAVPTFTTGPATVRMPLLVLLSSNISTGWSTQLKLDILTDCSSEEGAVGTQLTNWTSGTDVVFDPPPNTGGLFLTLCLATNAYTPKGVVTWTNLFSSPIPFVYVAIAPKYTASNTFVDHTLLITMDSSFGIITPYTYVGLYPTSECTGATAGDTSVLPWTEGLDILFDPTTPSPTTHTCLFTIYDSHRLPLTLSALTGPPDTFAISPSPALPTYNYYSHPVKGLPLTLTLSNDEISSPNTKLKLDALPDCSGGPAAGTAIEDWDSGTSVTFNPYPNTIGTFYVCVTTNFDTPKASGPTYRALTYGVGGPTELTIVGLPTYNFSLNVPVATMSLTVSITSQNGTSSSATTAVALDTSPLCANLMVDPTKGAMGTLPTLWTQNSYVIFDPPPTTASTLYVCLTNNYPASQPIYTRLFHANPTPDTLLTILPLPTYTYLNSYEARTLVIRMDSADAASTTTSVLLSDTNGTCPPAVAGLAAGTAPQNWVTGTDINFGPTSPFNGTTVCLSTNAGWLTTYVALSATTGTTDTFDILPETSFPTFLINASALFAQIPIKAMFSATDSVSLSTALRLSLDSACSGQEPALGTEIEPWTSPDLDYVDFSPGPNASVDALWVCMSTNIGSPKGVKWTLLQMTLPFNGVAPYFQVGGTVRYNYSNAFSRRTMFMEITEQNPAGEGTIIKLSKDECEGDLNENLASGTLSFNLVEGFDVKFEPTFPSADVYACLSTNGGLSFGPMYYGDQLTISVTPGTPLPTYEPHELINYAGYSLGILMTSAAISSPSTRIKLGADDMCNGTEVLNTHIEDWMDGRTMIYFPPWPNPYWNRVSVCLSSNYLTPSPNGETWRLLSITSGSDLGHNRTNFKLWERPTSQINITAFPTSDSFTVQSDFTVVAECLDERGVVTQHIDQYIRLSINPEANGFLGGFGPTPGLEETVLGIATFNQLRYTHPETIMIMATVVVTGVGNWSAPIEFNPDSASGSPTWTLTPSAQLTLTHPTISTTISNAPSLSFTATPTMSIPTLSDTLSSQGTATDTISESITHTPTSTCSATPQPTLTVSYTGTHSRSQPVHQTLTATDTLSPGATDTWSHGTTLSASSTLTMSSTSSATTSLHLSKSTTFVPTRTWSPDSLSRSVSASTFTATLSPATFSDSASPKSTNSATDLATSSISGSVEWTRTVSPTPNPTRTHSHSRPPTPTATASPPTPSGTQTHTLSRPTLSNSGWTPSCTTQSPSLTLSTMTPGTTLTSTRAHTKSLSTSPTFSAPLAPTKSTITKSMTMGTTLSDTVSTASHAITPTSTPTVTQRTFTTATDIGSFTASLGSPTATASVVGGSETMSTTFTPTLTPTTSLVRPHTATASRIVVSFTVTPTPSPTFVPTSSATQTPNSPSLSVSYSKILSNTKTKYPSETPTKTSTPNPTRTWTVTPTKEILPTTTPTAGSFSVTESSFSASQAPEITPTIPIITDSLYDTATDSPSLSPSSGTISGSSSVSLGTISPTLSMGTRTTNTYSITPLIITPTPTVTQTTTFNPLTLTVETPTQTWNLTRTLTEKPTPNFTVSATDTVPPQPTLTEVPVTLTATHTLSQFPMGPPTVSGTPTTTFVPTNTWTHTLSETGMMTETVNFTTTNTYSPTGSVPRFRVYTTDYQAHPAFEPVTISFDIGGFASLTQTMIAVVPTLTEPEGLGPASQVLLYSTDALPPASRQLLQVDTTDMCNTPETEALAQPLGNIGKVGLGPKNVEISVAEVPGAYAICYKVRNTDPAFVGLPDIYVVRGPESYTIEPESPETGEGIIVSLVGWNLLPYTKDPKYPTILKPVIGDQIGAVVDSNCSDPDLVPVPIEWVNVTAQNEDLSLMLTEAVVNITVLKPGTVTLCYNYQETGWHPITPNFTATGIDFLGGAAEPTAETFRPSSVILIVVVGVMSVVLLTMLIVYMRLRAAEKKLEAPPAGDEPQPVAGQPVPGQPVPFAGVGPVHDPVQPMGQDPNLWAMMASTLQDGGDDHHLKVLQQRHDAKASGMGGSPKKPRAGRKFSSISLHSMDDAKSETSGTPETDLIGHDDLKKEDGLKKKHRTSQWFGTQPPPMKPAPPQGPKPANPLQVPARPRQGSTAVPGNPNNPLPLPSLKQLMEDNRRLKESLQKKGLAPPAAKPMQAPVQAPTIADDTTLMRNTVNDVRQQEIESQRKEVENLFAAGAADPNPQFNATGSTISSLDIPGSVNGDEEGEIKMVVPIPPSPPTKPEIGPGEVDLRDVFSDGDGRQGTDPATAPDTAPGTAPGTPIPDVVLPGTE